MKEVAPSGIEERIFWERLDRWAVKAREWTPRGRPLRARILFAPGQGDYAKRYLDFFKPIVAMGVGVVSFDWPGHGESEGILGHVGGLEEARGLMDRLASKLSQDAASVPLGIAGHSMGGLLSLDFLSRQALGDFAWISSPLLAPAHGRPWWLVFGGHVLGRVIPRMTLDTGIRVGDCVAAEDEASLMPLEEAFFDGRGHSKISFGWGLALMRASKAVWRRRDAVFTRRRILCTQGSADPVCPADLCREYFAPANAVYHELDGALHEPFSDEAYVEEIQTALLASVAAWLESQKSENGA